MKAKLLFVSLLATAFLCGCSSDEQVVPPTDGNTTGEPKFLTVNLVTTGEASGTRATYEGEAPDGKATYEDGNEAENEVESVRFYFFDEAGNAANVKSEGEDWVNYSDWTPGLTEEPEKPNVEKIFSATLVLQTPNGDKTNAAKMVVIINPTTEIKNLGGCNRTKLEEEVANYAADNTTKGTFVMSNSTYKASDGSLAMAVNVADNITNDKASAIAKPVDVYVERTVAKVRLNCSLTKVENLDKDLVLYDPSDKNDKDPNKQNQQFNKKKIYVKFLGWNVTAAAQKSRLIKKINTSWKDDILGSNFGPWNWSAFHRSFWAINAAKLDYQYGDFNNDDNKAHKNDKFDGSQCAYLNENASDKEECTTSDTEQWCNKPSQVIIAAQLVDEEGNAMEFAEYGSQRVSVDDLKKLFASGCGLYKKTESTTESTTEVTYTAITPEELDIKTATELNQANQSVPGRYKVYVQLNDAAEQETWYPTNNKEQTEANALTKDEANKKLLDLGSAKVWTEGYTYYYFDINHVETPTTPGVVRNHIYDATITSLVGLGTPVYKPNEVIYPEHPTDDTDQYLAARIKVLTWRVVKNDVSLVW